MNELSRSREGTSIHNTQRGGSCSRERLELWADRGRQLAATDTDGWALLMSCGGALYLAGLGLAGEGWRTTTERLRDPTRRDLLARIASTDASLPRRLSGSRSLLPKDATRSGAVPPDAVSVELLDTCARPSVIPRCTRPS